MSPLPTRTSIATAHELRVRVIDQSDAAVDRATVRVARADSIEGEWATGTTARDGAAVLAIRARDVVVVVQHPDFAPAIGRHRLDGDSVSIKLTAAATLTLHFVDGDDRPVSGVAARLLPPVQSGADWSGDWARASARGQWLNDPLCRALFGDGLAAAAPRDVDSDQALTLGTCCDAPIALSATRTVAAPFRALASTLTTTEISAAGGEASFAALLPAHGYRWALSSRHLVQMAPTHESALHATKLGVRASNGSTLVTVSGSIDLVAGEQRTLTIRVIKPSTLRGRFATQLGSGRAQVKLYHALCVTAPTGLKVMGFEQELFTVADAQGAFVFTDVRPGPKMVRAYWTLGREDYFFAGAEAQAVEGRDVDLGVLQPTPGSCTAGHLSLVNRAGEELSAEAVFGRADLYGIVRVEAWNQQKRIDDSLFELIGVPLRGDFRLHGVPTGNLELTVSPGLNWPLCEDAGQRLADDRSVRRQTPSTEVIQIALCVEDLAPRQLTLRLPPELAKANLELWFRAVRDGRLVRAQVDADSFCMGGQATVDVHLPPEPHMVVALPRSGDAQSPAVFGEAEIDFAHQPSALLQLVPGAILRGTYRDAAGRPLPDEPVQWTFAPWTCDGQDVWLVRAQTDAEGRFEVRGLPPHRSLRGPRSGSDVVTPAAGRVAEVVLSDRRR